MDDLIVKPVVGSVVKTIPSRIKGDGRAHLLIETKPIVLQLETQSY